MLLRIFHETKFSYTAPVGETVFEVRKAPPTDDDQTALSYKLRISPAAPLTSYRDGFGNRVDLFNVATPYTELVVQATSYVRTHRRPAAARLAGVERDASETLAVEALEYLQPSPLAAGGPAVDAFVAEVGRLEGPAEEVVVRLVEGVRGRLKYEKRVTNSRTPVAEALEVGGGVCQDFAHLLIAASRAVGMPARYVSGYVAAPGELATHAWCQVWPSDKVGWVDVDPTRGLLPADDHVVTAVGRDYADVPPNRGLWKGRAEESMAVTVNVEPVDRVPMEWNEFAPPNPRNPGGFAQSQRQSASFQSQRLAWAPYPMQRSDALGLHQQQGEQQ